ncbi:hypothetical protein ERC79_19470 [Rhodococcus sp. ABRD24]|uniref:TY-Chap domain-containing protein n=1 Tax=Rhodococcus sp. ABRD24 TaxID=2507582 RepID=UPI001038C481|nr:hypothetical protein [Rhodococcus sp. ABRD24]QBJ97878.1 hypothetical protein ERC79_19470 [Rhodococcus sp. ABRD24]
MHDWGLMFDIESFDQAVERSWSRFQTALADHIAVMQDDDLLVLEWSEETTVDGFVPCVQFLVWDGDQIRCEVPSNDYLAQRYALSPSDEKRLSELGWDPPTRSAGDEPCGGSPAFYVDKEQRWSDQLASMAVTAFREIWSVPHPSFLRAEAAGTLAGSDLMLLDGTGSDTDPVEPSVDFDETTAVMACDQQELPPAFAAQFDGTRVIDEPAQDRAELAADLSEESGAEDDLPTALLTLLHSHPDGGGALSPEQVAAVCGRDRDSVRDYLKIALEQEISWRRAAKHARSESDAKGVEACEVQARAWAQTHESLRVALRFIALPSSAFPDSGRSGSGAAKPQPQPQPMTLFGNPTEQTLFDEPT